MGTTVNFGPSTLNCGVVPPKGTAEATATSEVLSAPANVTANISNDTSGGAFTVVSVASFVTKIEIEMPDPGELPPGVKPVPVKVAVPVQIAESNGVTPLAVLGGQYVEATIQFAPTASTPDTSTATLHVLGDTRNPVSIPIAATVGEISVNFPAISVTQGQSTTVDVSVTSVAGPTTNVTLILDPDGSADAPNVTASLKSTSFKLNKGTTFPTTLTASADSTLATATYSWTLSVWAFGNAYSFSVPVQIQVKAPIVLKTLSISHTPAELLIGEVNTLTINATDTKTGKAVDGLKVIVASIFSGITPESPHSDGVTGTALKYAVNISDSDAKALVLGAPDYQNYEEGIPLAYPPLKVWYKGGSGSWTIYGSGFIGNEVEITVDSEGFDHPGPYRGDITKGIGMRADCVNSGEYWTIHVQGLTITSQKVTTNVYC